MESLRKEFSQFIIRWQLRRGTFHLACALYPFLRSGSFVPKSLKREKHTFHTALTQLVPKHHWPATNVRSLLSQGLFNGRIIRKGEKEFITS